MTGDASRVPDYLEHVQQAIERIARYTAGMDEAAFRHDTLVQDAVIRNFEVIGEACRNILRDEPGLPRATRNCRCPARTRCAARSPAATSGSTWAWSGRPPPTTCRHSGQSWAPWCLRGLLSRRLAAVETTAVGASLGTPALPRRLARCRGGHQVPHGATGADSSRPATHDRRAQPRLRGPGAAPAADHGDGAPAAHATGHPGGRPDPRGETAAGARNRTWAG